MTIGRTDDPENPISVPAFEAAKLFGAGSRNPSGPADMVPRQQAGHMLAIDPPVKILNGALASKGPSRARSPDTVMAGAGRPPTTLLRQTLQVVDGGPSPAMTR
jgi:hypothetical protein